MSGRQSSLPFPAFAGEGRERAFFASSTENISESGLILVNVLLFVAIAASIVMLLIAAGDAAVTRAGRVREAARALAVAHGGELSAITALRRDLARGGDGDHRGEPWAALEEREQPIEGGSFDLAIADANGRFNVNAVKTNDVGAVVLLDRIATSAGVPRETTARAIALIRMFGPVSDLRPLERAGLDAATLARLAPLLTALPYATRVNVNAADEGLLAAMTNDPVGAARMASLRAAQGYLTQADFAGQAVSLPAGAGFTSDLYWVRTRVRIGDTSQQLTSLIRRRRLPDGTIHAAAIGRWLGARPPAQAPAF